MSDVRSTRGNYNHSLVSPHNRTWGGGGGVSPHNRTWGGGGGGLTTQHDLGGWGGVLPMSDVRSTRGDYNHSLVSPHNRTWGGGGSHHTTGPGGGGGGSHHTTGPGGVGGVLPMSDIRSTRGDYNHSLVSPHNRTWGGVSPLS